MRRQAVHDLDLRAGQLEQFPVDLVVPERRQAHVVLGLLAHARERVGVDDVGALDGGAHVVGELDAPAGLTGVLLCPRDDVHVGAVAGRGAGDHVHPGLGADLGERVRDVVAVADVDEPHALEAPDVLADGRRVGHAVAGVMVVDEAVDHRDLAVGGEVLDVLLGEGADHDAVDVAAHHVGGVPDGLADAQLDVGGVEEDGLGAELLDAHLEA